MTVSLNGDVEVLTEPSSPLFSSASRLSAAPSGSFLVHVPAERRGSDPSQIAPLIPRSPVIQLCQPGEYVAWRASARTTSSCGVHLVLLVLERYEFKAPRVSPELLLLFDFILGGGKAGTPWRPRQGQADTKKSH